MKKIASSKVFLLEEYRLSELFCEYINENSNIDFQLEPHHFEIVVSDNDVGFFFKLNDGHDIYKFFENEYSLIIEDGMGSYDTCNLFVLLICKIFELELDKFLIECNGNEPIKITEII